MKTDIKERWLDALESGEYAQTMGRLERIAEVRDDDGTLVCGTGFCCLGVLCNLAAREGVVTRVVVEKGDCCPKCSPVVWYGNSTGFVPRAVQEWAGLDNENPEWWGEENEHISLTALNDGGSSFAEIATVIREKF